MGTPFSNANEYTMRAFVVVSSILAACRAEASLPLAAGYGYAGVAPYATHGAIAAAHATYGVAPAYAHAAYAAPVVAHAAPVVAHAAPVVAKAAPVGAAAPVVNAVAAPAVPSVTSTQYRAGDEFGNNAFGYSNINSARQESGNEAGVTGSYSYVDEAGVHTRHYVADAYGFRVTGDNLPVAPVVAHRRRRSVVAPINAFPYAAAGYAAPVVSNGAVRDATLTTIKLNPGHAVFYRVD